MVERSELGVGTVHLRSGERGTKREAVGFAGGLVADGMWVLSPLSRGSDGLYVHRRFGLLSGLGLRSSALQSDTCIE